MRIDGVRIRLGDAALRFRRVRSARRLLIRHDARRTDDEARGKNRRRGDLDVGRDHAFDNPLRERGRPRKSDT